MTTAREGNDETDGRTETEYPAGTEVESDPPGVGDGVEEEDQPGMAEDPPQAD